MSGQAVATLQRVEDVAAPSTFHPQPLGVSSHSLPPPSSQRRLQSLTETAFDAFTFAAEASGDVTPDARSTVLYLAYGSNLSAETFRGKRGIKPLAQVNVVVPELFMTFDLPGLPYTEPCFANTRYRKNPNSTTFTEKEETQPPSAVDVPKYHKDRWKKGLVGVVYEVSRKDYAHIIATEGGGSSYQDILVDCYVLPSGVDTVPKEPYTDMERFKAHTLFSPAIPATPPGKPPPTSGGRIQRPDPSYAQASARYLKLITDGAEEHDLPAEYKDYLYDLRPYTITTNRQRLGLFIFYMVWGPIVKAAFMMAGLFAGKDGRVPAWVAEFLGAMFKAIWASYDAFFYQVFGDGERTLSKDEDEERRPLRVWDRCYGATGRTDIAEKGIQTVPWGS